MEKERYNEAVQEWMTVVEENNATNAELTLQYCDKILEYGEAHQDDSLIAFAHYHQGVVYYVKNDGVRFYEAVTQALTSLSRVDEWILMARCYNFLGIFSVNHGNLAIGLDYYIHAMQCCDRTDAKDFASLVNINMGALYILSGRYDDAIECLEKAEAYYGKHPELPRYDDYMVCVYENKAKAHLCKGELVESKCCFEKIYADYGDYLDTEAKLTVWATEATYYYIAGDEAKCRACMDYIHREITENMPIMDMFDDFYDYCRMLLDLDAEEEFWKLVDIMEPMVHKLDITNLMLKMLHLKIEFYHKHDRTEEYLQSTALYYEYSKRASDESKTMMNSVLNLRRTLEQLYIEKKEIEEKNAMLQEKSETDALTGLSNRFRLNDYSNMVFQEALEQGTPLALEILDIDCFKEYNDCYGHQQGDACIRMVADAVKSMEEYGAFTARYGGDEFILIYRDITKEKVIEYAAELRKRVMDLGLRHEKSKGMGIVTISQGICWDIPGDGNGLWDYYQVSDDMLYRVKQRKRNNFCIGNLTESGDQIVMSYL